MSHGERVNEGSRVVVVEVVVSGAVVVRTSSGRSSSCGRAMREGVQQVSVETG